MATRQRRENTIPDSPSALRELDDSTLLKHLDTLSDDLASIAGQVAIRTSPEATWPATPEWRAKVAVATYRKTATVETIKAILDGRGIYV